jgi:hypothetical protein
VARWGNISRESGEASRCKLGLSLGVGPGVRVSSGLWLVLGVRSPDSGARISGPNTKNFAEFYSYVNLAHGAYAPITEKTCKVCQKNRAKKLYLHLNILHT